MSLLNRAYNFLITKIKSQYFQRFVDDGSGKIVIVNNEFRLNITKHKGAKIILNGKLRFESFLGSNSSSCIILNEDSTLIINGDFDIGSGVRIALSEGAKLEIGGRNTETGSGITADSIILCHKNINIGTDLICSWNVFISDTDTHLVVGNKPYADINIGKHVWIGQGAKVLKGCVIGDDSIVAAGAVVLKGKYPVHSILAGIPAKVIKQGVNWKRDIK
jgi:acetyltransferase-like isoleucine patch superfamily enzyme